MRCRFVVAERTLWALAEAVAEIAVMRTHALEATPAVRVVLFDIDGTIIRPRSALQAAHVDALITGVAAVAGAPPDIGWRDREMYCADQALTGLTDAATVAIALESIGVDPTPGTIGAAIEVMIDVFRKRIVRRDERDSLLPGIRALATELRRAGVVVGLASGNARTIAETKMDACRLQDLFACGGFGDTALTRSGVIGAAFDAASKVVHGLAPDEVAHVGDTPHDVAAAKHAGLWSVAIASGDADVNTLAAAAPHLLAARAHRSLAHQIQGLRPSHKLAPVQVAIEPGL